jgi:hypothetical protein
MAEIIDLEFYRKFRVILHIRGTTRQQVLKDKAYGTSYQTKHLRRKRKIDLDSKLTTKD